MIILKVAFTAWPMIRIALFVFEWQRERQMIEAAKREQTLLASQSR